MKKLSDGINIEDFEILTLLKENVLRRELIDVENESVNVAATKVNKFYKQTAKKPAPKCPVKEKKEEPVQQTPQKSLTEQLLQEAESNAVSTPVVNTDVTMN